MRPLDQQRLLRACRGAPDRRGAHPHAGKARAQRIGRAVAPRDGAPGVFRQAERQLLGAHALVRIGQASSFWPGSVVSMTELYSSMALMRRAALVLSGRASDIMATPEERRLF